MGLHTGKDTRTFRPDLGALVRQDVEIAGPEETRSIGQQGTDGKVDVSFQGYQRLGSALMVGPEVVTVDSGAIVSRRVRRVGFLPEWNIVVTGRPVRKISPFAKITVTPHKVR